MCVFLCTWRAASTVQWKERKKKSDSVDGVVAKLRTSVTEVEVETVERLMFYWQEPET